MWFQSICIYFKQSSKRYLVLQIDAEYLPSKCEERTVYGLRLKQKRNSVCIKPEVFGNILSKSKKASILVTLFYDIVSPFESCADRWKFQLPKSALNDLIVATIAVKYKKFKSVCYAYRGQVCRKINLKSPFAQCVAYHTIIYLLFSKLHPLMNDQIYYAETVFILGDWARDQSAVWYSVLAFSRRKSSKLVNFKILQFGCQWLAMLLFFQVDETTRTYLKITVASFNKARRTLKHCRSYDICYSWPRNLWRVLEKSFCWTCRTTQQRKFL